MPNPYLPQEAEVVARIQEAPTIFTLHLRFTDAAAQAAFRFAPGQFNMLYLYGVGEVPISIVSDPLDEHAFAHTIRVVGRVTQGLAQLEVGARVGLRGPYGRGWPLRLAEGRDVVLVTGGLGCAPVVSVIHYVMRRRQRFRKLVIMQGVKHSTDLLWREQYAAWAGLPDTQVLLAADVGGPDWTGLVGRVTVLFDQAEFNPQHAIAMMCGPEIMMRGAAQEMIARGVSEDSVWLSMERNMQCAIGHCGHCQYGPSFVCKDGPVFNYAEAQPLLGVRGY